MGVFDDKKFQEFDWLSQATEPIESKLNALLSMLPEKFVVDYRFLEQSIKYMYFSNSISKSRLLTMLVSEHIHGTLPYKEHEMLLKCFKLTVGPEVSIDFQTQILVGEIVLDKVTHILEDKDLEKLLGLAGIEKVSRMQTHETEQMSRANEVMELLGDCAEGLKTRSADRKRRIITHRVQQIFVNNEWKIKDTELANKVGTWIAAYVTDGNLAAWSNFCRLKVMTHKGVPIYSMEEVE